MAPLLAGVETIRILHNPDSCSASFIVLAAILVMLIG